ncbi:MAG: hypothetical protein ACI3U1_07410, partial [Peptococcaceae bacterium]
MQTIDYTIIILYLGMMILAGFIGLKKAKNTEDYLVSGRSLPLPIFVCCVSTVVIGGGATFGQATNGYNFGISAMWMVTMFGIGVLTLGFLLSSKLSNLRILTIGEMLRLRYDNKAQWFSAIISAFYTIMVAVTNTIALGACIQTIFGWSLPVSIMLVSCICILYTLLGGMISLNIMDVIQFILMTVAIFFVLVPSGLSHLGGISGLQAVLPESYFDPFAVGGMKIFSWFVLFGFGLMIGQDVWQRVFTAKSCKVAKQGTIIAGIYIILWAGAMTLAGMFAMALLPDITPQNALSEITLAIVPSGFIGIVFAGIISAFMSTIAGTIIASSTLISNDILKLKGNSLLYSRITIIVIGLVVMLTAIKIGSVLTALDIAYAILSGSIFVPVVAGFFWKRANWQGAVSSMAASAIVILLSMVKFGTSSPFPILIGVAVSIVTLVAVSLLTPPVPANQAAVWEAKLSSEEATQFFDECS